MARANPLGMRILVVLLTVIPLLAFERAATANNALRAAKRFALQVSRGTAEKHRISASGTEVTYQRDRHMTATMEGLIADSRGLRHRVSVRSATLDGTTSRTFEIAVSSLDPAFRGPARQTMSLNLAVSPKRKVRLSMRTSLPVGQPIGKVEPYYGPGPADAEKILAASLRGR